MAFIESTAKESSPSDSSSQIGDNSICHIIDRDPDLRGAAISYISDDQAIPIRGSDLVIENHVVITPHGDDGVSGSRLKEGLIDVGVDCGLSAVAYTMTAAACGGTAITLGVAAPLCVVGVVGTTTNTWKCANSIGKVINDWQNPNLNLNLERSNHWFNDFNHVVDWIDNAASFIQIGSGLKNAYKLNKLAAKHAGKVGTQYTRKESVQAYRELSEAMSESLGKGNQAAKRWINMKGYSPRFSPKVITGEMEKALIGIGLDVVDWRDDDVKAGIKAVMNTQSAERQRYRPRHVMHVLQQAR